MKRFTAIFAASIERDRLSRNTTVISSNWRSLRSGAMLKFRTSPTTGRSPYSVQGRVEATRAVPNDCEWLAWQSGVAQDEFERDGPGIAVGILNGDLNAAAAAQVDERGQVLVRFQAQRPSIGGTDIELLRTAVGRVRFSRRMQIGKFENPVNPIEGNTQDRRTRAQDERTPAGDWRSHQFDQLLLVGPQNDARVAFTQISSRAFERLPARVAGIGVICMPRCGTRRKDMTGRISRPTETASHTGAQKWQEADHRKEQGQLERKKGVGLSLRAPAEVRFLRQDFHRQRPREHRRTRARQSHSDHRMTCHLCQHRCLGASHHAERRQQLANQRPRVESYKHLFGEKVWENRSPARLRRRPRDTRRTIVSRPRLVLRRLPYRGRIAAEERASAEQTRRRHKQRSAPVGGC